MYHRERRKMKVLILFGIASLATAQSNNTDSAINKNGIDDNFDNNIIDFDEDYSVKFNKNYGGVSWNSNEGFNKESHRYTVLKDDASNNDKENRLKNKINKTKHISKDDEVTQGIVDETTTSINDYSSIPIELLSTTVDPLVSIVESTIEPDLSVIPLTTTKPNFPEVVIKQTVTLPPSTQIPDTTPDMLTTTDVDIQSTTSIGSIEMVKHEVINKNDDNLTKSAVTITSTSNFPSTVETTTEHEEVKIENITSNTGIEKGSESKVLNSNVINATKQINLTKNNDGSKNNLHTSDELNSNVTELASAKSTIVEDENNKVAQNSSIEKAKDNLESRRTGQTNNHTNENMTDKNTKDRNTTTVRPKKTKDRKNSTNLEQSKNKTRNTGDSSEDLEVPIFTGLDTEEDTEVPEDYYDSKDVLPTSAPKTDALSVIFGLAGSVVESVVESVAERVVPRGIFDLFKRMQKQNEALEAERLRSREENGGLGQFGRGLLKSISSGLSGPLTQLIAARDIGSLDTDRGFVSSVSTSVASAATTLADAFKDRVQAIYPGTVWCGDGHASSRSGELGLFFFTDTCCRQHDACRLYIRAGDTKHGLTNTGLFTRSHCGCDSAFRECLRRTNSLVSAQIGLTYFNVLGPQCFRKAHPIVRCLRRTRITGQKCEEYELDYTKPKMWQWFDNETF